MVGLGGPLKVMVSGTTVRTLVLSTAAHWSGAVITQGLWMLCWEHMARQQQDCGIRGPDSHAPSQTTIWSPSTDKSGNSRTLGGNWETLVKPEIKDSTLRMQVHADLPNGNLTALHTAPLPKEAGRAMPTHAPGSRPTDHGPAYRSRHKPVTQLQPCSGYRGSPVGPGAQWEDAQEPGRSHTCADLWKHTSRYRPSSGPEGSPWRSFSLAWLQSMKQFCPLGIWQEPQLTATLATSLSNGEPLHCGSSTVSQLQSHRDPGGTHQSRSPEGQGLYLPETASRDRKQVFVPSNTRTSTQVYTDQ